MNAPLIIFFVLAALCVVGAISLILQRHPIHSALSPIMVLFVFVIMLLNAGIEERTNLSKLAGFAGIPLGVALTGFLAAAVARSQDMVQGATQTGAPAPTKALANLLFQDFVYPFELTSFLILIAILGAIVLAQRENA